MREHLHASLWSYSLQILQGQLQSPRVTLGSIPFGSLLAVATLVPALAGIPATALFAALAALRAFSFATRFRGLALSVFDLASLAWLQGVPAGLVEQIHGGARDFRLLQFLHVEKLASSWTLVRSDESYDDAIGS